jgi:hypothetical protein
MTNVEGSPETQIMVKRLLFFHSDFGCFRRLQFAIRHSPCPFVDKNMTGGAGITVPRGRFTRGNGTGTTVVMA